MMNFLRISTHRTGYAPDQCHDTLTVGELIELLSQFPDDEPVYFSNDRGYTYGEITEDDLDEAVYDGEEVLPVNEIDY